MIYLVFYQEIEQLYIGRRKSEIDIELRPRLSVSPDKKKRASERPDSTTSGISQLCERWIFHQTLRVSAT